MNMTIDEMKVLWVVGALERLGTLGMLNPDVPYKLTSDAIDSFVAIDDLRDKLFPYEEEIGFIFKSLSNNLDAPAQEDEVDDIIELILEYKNNRTEMFKYAMRNAK